MEFWGVEVRNDESVKVTHRCGRYLHLTQASIRETGDTMQESVCLEVKFLDKTSEKVDLCFKEQAQQPLAMWSNKDFEISHNLRNGSVFILGFFKRRMNTARRFGEGAETAKEDGDKVKEATTATEMEIETGEC